MAIEEEPAAALGGWFSLKICPHAAAKPRSLGLQISDCLLAQFFPENAPHSGFGGFPQGSLAPSPPDMSISSIQGVLID